MGLIARMTSRPIIVWFRDDLRLSDHPALHTAPKPTRRRPVSTRCDIRCVDCHTAEPRTSTRTTPDLANEYRAAWRKFRVESWASQLYTVCKSALSFGSKPWGLSMDDDKPVLDTVTDAVSAAPPARPPTPRLTVVKKVKKAAKKAKKAVKKAVKKVAAEEKEGQKGRQEIGEEGQEGRQE